jgi:hypothetical protein
VVGVELICLLAAAPPPIVSSHGYQWVRDETLDAPTPRRPETPIRLFTFRTCVIQSVVMQQR